MGDSQTIGFQINCTVRVNTACHEDFKLFILRHSRTSKTPRNTQNFPKNLRNFENVDFRCLFHSACHNCTPNRKTPIINPFERWITHFYRSHKNHPFFHRRQSSRDLCTNVHEVIGLCWKLRASSKSRNWFFRFKMGKHARSRKKKGENFFDWSTPLWRHEPIDAKRQKRPSGFVLAENQHRAMLINRGLTIFSPKWHPPGCDYESPGAQSRIMCY